MSDKNPKDAAERPIEDAELVEQSVSIAIDSAAMRDGADSTDDYLAEWRRSEPAPCGEDLDAEAAAHEAALDAEYTADRVRALVENGGKAAE